MSHPRDADGPGYGAGPSSPTLEYEPDPRSAPGFWTARKLLLEKRPPRHAGGYGGQRSLKAVCGSCRVERFIDPTDIIRQGKGDRPLSEFRFRCKCGGAGTAWLVWNNPPRMRDRNGMQVRGKPRGGTFNLATGERRGKWD